MFIIHLINIRNVNKNVYIYTQNTDRWIIDTYIDNTYVYD